MCVLCLDVVVEMKLLCCNGFSVCSKVVWFIMSMLVSLFIRRFGWCVRFVMIENWVGVMLIGVRWCLYSCVMKCVV